MVAPNPNVRIAPSGPIAGAEDPFNQYAGAFFQVQGYNGNAANYSPAKIGPSSSGDFADRAYLVKDGATQGVNIGAKSVAIMDGDTVSQDFRLGVGKWIVEASLQCGYDTTIPDIQTYGRVRIAFQTIDNAGVVIEDNIVDENSVLARGVIDGSSQSPSAAEWGVVNSGTFKKVIEITEAMILANGGNDFQAPQIELTRLDSNDGNLGDYGTTSGWLEFPRVSNNMTVRRFR